MLFDDDEQLEVRHVISLAHHDVSIYSGGDTTPEGELYIKKNAIRLSRKFDAGDTAPDSQVSKPFYLFSESCSAKEDFYFALLRNQELALSTEKEVPEPLHFDVQDIISLVHRLHAGEDQAHTRWLNALIGRVFLAIYKTRDLEDFVREKLTKKISRVKRPSFLSRIVIRDVHPGTSAPYIFNPRLKELNVEGECVLEADIRYTGNFRIEVATTARIDLGARFKVREVDLVLSVALRKIEGRGLLKLKAPPSNRFWFAFQTMPKMEMNIEPLVSSRQITYTMIIRQIENRIKEVVAESIVLPFWDDTPFVNTEGKKWRGGIWAGDNEQKAEPAPEVIRESEAGGDANHHPETLDLSGQKEPHPLEKSYTDPLAGKSPTSSIFGRKGSTKAQSEKGVKASTTALDTAGRGSGSWPASARSSPNVSIAQDSAKGEASVGKKEALNTAVATLSAVAGSPPKPTSPLASGRPSLTKSSGDTHADQGAGTAAEDDAAPVEGATPAPEDGINRRHAASSTESVNSMASTNGKASSLKSQAGSISRGFFRQDTGASTSSATTTSSNGGAKNNTLAAVSNAAIQAKQWGLHALQRNKRGEQGQRGGQPRERNHGVDLSQPMGRGRPLPPPGTPLPPPDRASKATKIPPRRKPLPPPIPGMSTDSLEGGGGSADARSLESGGGSAEVSSLEEGKGEDEGDRNGGGNRNGVKRRPVPPPPLPKRPHRLEEENVFVVAAPVDSEPGSPRGSGVACGDLEEQGGEGEENGETLEPLSPAGNAGDDGKSPEVPAATVSGEEERRPEAPAATVTEEEEDGNPPEAPRTTVTEKEEDGKTPEAPRVTATEERGEDDGKSRKAPAATVTEEAEEDDGYAGWMDDGVFDEGEESIETGPGDGAVGR